MVRGMTLVSDLDLARDNAAPTEIASVKVVAQSSGSARRSVKQMAVRGSLWTIFGFGAAQILRLGSNLVLTRLLFPKAFGLMSLISIFMQGLTMFSDLGIGPSIVRSQRGEDDLFLHTAWTIQ